MPLMMVQSSAIGKAAYNTKAEVKLMFNWENEQKHEWGLCVQTSVSNSKLVSMTINRIKYTNDDDSALNIILEMTNYYTVG